MHRVEDTKAMCAEQAWLPQIVKDRRGHAAIPRFFLKADNQLDHTMNDVFLLKNYSIYTIKVSLTYLIEF